jgi:hypothetical protein
MPAAPPIPLSDHLAQVPATVRPTLDAAIRTVKEVAPNAKEITYRSQPPRSSRTMWKIVRYSVDSGYVVGIGTFSSHVTMFFYRGRDLDDGSGLLQGGGKDKRSITLRAPEDAERPVVKRLVRKAFKFGGSTV